MGTSVMKKLLMIWHENVNESGESLENKEYEKG